MAEPTISDVATNLLRLLSEERELLRAGRAREALSLAAEKLASLEWLEKAVARGAVNRLAAKDIAAIDAVQSAARENAAHFAAVRNGVAALLSRISGLGADQSVGAYDRRGGKVPFPETAGAYSKRV